MPAQSLPCESKLEYTFINGSKTGLGRTEDAATINALGEFPQNAEVDAKTAAINDATAKFTCDSPCNRDVTTGAAAFKKTGVTPPPSPAGNFSVTVTIEVPMVVTCRKRHIAALAAPIFETPSEFASFLPLAEEDLSESDTAAVIAYLSITQHKIFVKKGHVSEAARALGAKRGGKKFKVEGIDRPFELLETADNPQVYACKDGDEEEQEPKEGARRVVKDRKCGRVRPAQRGRCTRLGEELYGRIDVRPLAWCRFALDHTCTEFFTERRRVRFYSDAKCTKLITEYSELGWSCVALF